jgi:hypothetical protein
MSVLWLAVAAFAIGTEAFVIAGLLPVIASDLQISLAATGQLVTAYALTYAVGSPILAVTFNNLDRRTVLTLALCCFIAGNLLAVVAASFAMLLVSRMLMALGAGLCMPTALAVAVAIASPERRGRHRARDLRHDHRDRTWSAAGNLDRQPLRLAGDIYPGCRIGRRRPRRAAVRIAAGLAAQHGYAWPAARGGPAQRRATCSFNHGILGHGRLHRFHLSGNPPA